MLEINDLTTCYYRRQIRAVDSVRIKIPPSCIFALVGESGCGKTTLGLSITGLIDPREGRITSGSVIFEGKNILRLSKKELCDIRGKKISYIFQEPATSLNPVFTIGEQIKESLIVHKIIRGKGKVDALSALKMTGLSDCERVYNSFPHQLSGGMKQRAMIAMAISTRPRLLIADEPTTALDVNTAAGIFQLLLALRTELLLSVLIITHDIRIVKRVSDKTAVMHKGRIVEVDDTVRLFNNPRHPYTKMLIESLPENIRA